MKNPLLPIAIALAAGIFFADRVPLTWGWAIPYAGMALLLLVLMLKLAGKKMQKAFMPFALAAFLCMGYGLQQNASPLPSSLPSDEHLYELRIRRSPSASTYSWKAEAEVIRMKDSSGWRDWSQHNRVMLRFPKETLPPQRGDLIVAYCRLAEPSPALNPYQFDYSRFLQRKGIVREGRINGLTDSADIASGKRPYSIISSSSDGLQERMIEVIHRSDLSPSQQGIAEALLLGYDDDVSTETRNLFRNAGIMHLLCVSGLHVGIVAAILGGLFFFLGANPRRRIIKGALQLAGVWGFVWLTGMAPSSLRAGIMFSFLIVGRMVSSRPPTLNIIAASALFLLLIRPGLLFDVSFQLSYSGVLGIVLFYKPMEGMLRIPSSLKKKWTIPLGWMMEKMWSLVCISTVAQVCTLPFTLYYFHQFPPYFLLANITIIPFAGLLLASVMMMVVLYWWPAAFMAVGKMVWVELTLVDGLTRWVSALPHALIEDICFPWPMALLAMVILVVWALAIYSDRRPTWVWLSAMLPLCLVAGAILLNFSHKGQNYWIVYSTPRVTAMEHFEGLQSRLFLAASPEELRPEEIDYYRKNLVVNNGIRQSRLTYCDTTSHLYAMGNGTLLLLDRSNISLFDNILRQEKASTLPARVTYLLMSETPWLTPLELRQAIDYDTLLIASNNSPRYRLMWHSLCEQNAIPYIDLAEEGAKTGR